jgi:hypothetical protein
MKLYNACALVLLTANALQASADKPAWTPARPTQPAPKTSTTASSITAGAQSAQEKPTWVLAKPTKTPSATAGAQRVKEEAAAPTATKKTSTSQVAIKTAGKAAPEVIKHLPGLIESIHGVATGGTKSTSTPTPSTASTQAAQPQKQEKTFYYELGNDNEEEETEGQ